MGGKKTMKYKKYYKNATNSYLTNFSPQLFNYKNVRQFSFHLEITLVSKTTTETCPFPSQYRYIMVTNYYRY